MNIYILIIFVFLLKPTIESDGYEVYGGNYGDVFKFIISGTVNRTINSSSNVEINFYISGNDQQTAKCSVENTNKGGIATYSCTYEGNIEDGKPIFVSKKQELDIGILLEADKQIKPNNLSMIFSQALHLQLIDNIWQYDLYGKLIGEVDIPLGSLTYMNIMLNDDQKNAGCILTKKNSTEVNFSCKVNAEKQFISDEIIISKSNNNYLKFQPALEDKDINILVNKTIPFIKAEKLLYNKDNIWQFEITVQKYSIPIGSKSIVDILYNGTLSQANCFCNNSNSLNCFIEKDNQTEYDLIKIQFIQSSKSTITWEDLTYVYEIPIEKELDYINITDLTSSSNKQLWTYKINFENGTLPLNGLVKVDFIINNNYTYANCYFFDSVLNCETNEIKNSSIILLSYII